MKLQDEIDAIHVYRVTKPFAQAVGPVYELAGVMRRTELSQTEVESRTQDGKVLALATRDGHVGHPVWKFGRGVTAGLTSLLEIFSAAKPDSWMVAAWITASNHDLGVIAPVE